MQKVWRCIQQVCDEIKDVPVSQHATGADVQHGELSGVHRRVQDLRQRVVVEEWVLPLVARCDAVSNAPPHEAANERIQQRC